MAAKVDYYEIFQERYAGSLLEDISRKIDAINDPTEQEGLRGVLCDDLLSNLIAGYTKYSPEDDLPSLPLYKLFMGNVRKLGKDWYAFWAVYYFYKKENTKCLENIQNLLDTFAHQFQEENSANTPFLDETLFVSYLLEPFKNGFDGFWQKISELLEAYPIGDDIRDYCKLIGQFYTLNSEDEVIDVLLQFHQKYPAYRSVLELLGFQYYEKKMWRNAICYFEKATEDGDSLLYPLMSIYFSLAWCYGKIKDTRQEEANYRECAEISREAPFVLNNLGYCLFKQKRYKAAKTLFEECLEKKLDVQFAANNYVRVLIALGRNKDAKAFIKKGEFNVQKSLKEKVVKLENTNARIKEDVVTDILEQEEGTTQTTEIDFGLKRQQFSSEKLLEDELTLRLEAGMPIFGMNLHVYNHKGDYYGRQYPFEMGRLDLLCEDENGDLYIIELKKDSGYGDAYVQTAQYLDWFEKAPIAKGKRVYGIICLNSPTQALISKVRNDQRMRLFEYQISYTEIK